jgi:hypothetical protein
MANYNPLEFTNPSDLTPIWDESIEDEQQPKLFHIDHLFAPPQETNPPCNLNPPPPTTLSNAPIEFNFPNPVPKSELPYTLPLYEDPLGEALDDEVTDVTTEVPQVPVKEDFSLRSFPVPMPLPMPFPLPYNFPPPIPQSPLPLLKRTLEPDQEPPLPDPEDIDMDIKEFKLPASKTPVMEAMVVCALNRWGIELVKHQKTSNTAEVEFRVFDFNRYYKVSRAICSKHRPTDDLGARIKSLRRWFVAFPKKKDRIENSFSLIVKPTIAIKVYDIIERNSTSSLVKRRRKL